MADPNFHEAYGDQGLEVGSDRSFGLVIGGALGIVGLLPLRDGGELRVWALIAAAPFVLLALVHPRWLHPLNVGWMRFGAVLNTVVSPIVMGVVFFLIVTPMGLVMRALGKDLLRLRRDPAARSYWIDRTPPGPAPESMRNQF
jgi:hypothetical protein